MADRKGLLNTIWIRLRPGEQSAGGAGNTLTSGESGR